MSAPLAHLRSHRGARYALGPGALIGRAVTATCRLDDPRVSEAHAMVSLRGSALHLLALRGSVRVDGVEDDDFPLEEGQVLALAAGVTLTVEGVELPRKVLALQLGDRPPQVLRAALYSLVLRPQPEFVPRYLPESPARAWSAAEGWLFQAGDDPPSLIRPSQEWAIGGVSLRACALSLAELAAAPTEREGASAAGLRVVARHTTVHLHREQRVPAVIDGMPGRLLSELAVMGCPAPWDAVAQALWPDEGDRRLLRRRWDRVRERLSAALAEYGIRENLVRTDKSGNWELFLLPGDSVVDES